MLLRMRSEQEEGITLRDARKSALLRVRSSNTKGPHHEERRLRRVSKDGGKLDLM